MKLVDMFYINNKISDEKRKIYKIAGFLHDIGKLNTEDEILKNSEELLSNLQYEKIKNHPNIGRELLEKISADDTIIAAAYAHHERLDGTSYPQGLRGNEIPLITRVVAIADAYEALTGERSYQDPKKPTEALEILTNNAKEGKYDPQILEDFKKSLIL